jgi:Fe-S-cluster containining protein
VKTDHAETVAEIARRNGGTLEVLDELYAHHHVELRRTFHTGYAARDGLTRPLPIERMRQHRDELHGFLDAIAGGIQDAAKAAGERGPACRAGCHFCCHQHLYLSTVEVVFILDHLVAHPGDAERIIGRARRMAGQTSQMNRAERFAAGVPCPALGPAGLCTLYEARPEACASYFSRSRTACEAGWRKRQRPAERSRGIPIYGGAQAFGHTIVAGLDAAFLEAGFEVELVELTDALALAADLPGGFASTVERWLAGDKQFAAIGCAEPARWETIVRLEQARWV